MVANRLCRRPTTFFGQSPVSPISDDLPAAGHRSQVTGRRSQVTCRHGHGLLRDKGRSKRGQGQQPASPAPSGLSAVFPPQKARQTAGQ